MAQNLHRRSFMALQQAQAASSARLNTANTRTATTPCQTAPTGSPPPTRPTRRTHPRIHRSSVTDEFLNPTRPSLETGPYGTREQQLLLDEGRIDEAEKYALAARETVSAEDIVSRATTRVALAQVRAAQGRNEEAETLFSEALEIVSGAELCRILLDVLPPYAEFLRGLDREAEAVELDARLAERVPTAA